MIYYFLMILCVGWVVLWLPLRLTHKATFSRQALKGSAGTTVATVSICPSILHKASPHFFTWSHQISEQQEMGWPNAPALFKNLLYILEVLHWLMYAHGNHRDFKISMCSFLCQIMSLYIFSFSTSILTGVYISLIS